MGSSIGGLVGAVGGSFFGAPTVGAALGSSIGGMIGGGSQSGAAATAQGNAAQNMAGATNRAVQGATFRPVGVTTSFGGSNFEVDPATGQLTSAGYNLSPQLQGIQQGLLNTAAGYNPAQYQNASQGLFNLGQSYLATSPQQAATDYYNQQRQLLAPGREQSLAQVQNQQFQTGRSGLGVGGTSAGYTAGGPGLMQSNPQLAALYNAQAQQDAGLAAQADQYGQQRTQFGLGLMNAAPGLFSAGYSPLSNILGLSNTLEGMGQNSLSLGSALGAQQSTAGAQAGRLGIIGADAGNPYMIKNQSYSPLGTILSAGNTPGAASTNMDALGQAGGKLGTWFGDLIGNPATAFKYGTNLGSEQTRMLAAQEF
jgi:hypothetical protein